jgi:hypothetical protein
VKQAVSKVCLILVVPFVPNRRLIVAVGASHEETERGGREGAAAAEPARHPAVEVVL